jgi:DNA-binding transcriptional LysR family regulator
MLELKGLEKGDVSIAMPAMHGAFYFPEIVSAFMDKYPNIRIHAKEEGIQEIEQDLLNGTVDLGLIVAGQAGSDVEVVPLMDEEMVACVPTGHPRLKGRTVTMQDVLKEPLIVLRSGYFLREKINRAAEESGIRPNVVFETNLFIVPLFKKLVRDGRGIGICLRLLLKGEKELRGLSFNPPIHLRMGVAWKKGRYLSAANRAFVDFMVRKT